MFNNFQKLTIIFLCLPYNRSTFNFVFYIFLEKRDEHRKKWLSRNWKNFPNNPEKVWNFFVVSAKNINYLSSKLGFKKLACSFDVSIHFKNQYLILRAFGNNIHKIIQLQIKYYQVRFQKILTHFKIQKLSKLFTVHVSKNKQNFSFTEYVTVCQQIILSIYFYRSKATKTSFSAKKCENIFQQTWK